MATGLAEATGRRLTVQEIAGGLNITPRAVRWRLRRLIESLNGTRGLYVSEERGRGGTHMLIDEALIRAAWPAADLKSEIRDLKSECPATDWKFEIRDLKSEQPAGGHGQTRSLVSSQAASYLPAPGDGRDLPPAARAASWPPPQSNNPIIPNSKLQMPESSSATVPDLKFETSRPGAIELASGQRLLPFAPRLDAEMEALIPVSKRPLALARRAALEPIISCDWRRWQSQTIHNVAISNLDSYVRALAKDSEFAIGEILRSAQNDSPAMLDWRGINQALQIATSDPRARITPVSARTLWRWWGWWRNGRSEIRDLKFEKAKSRTVNPHTRKSQRLAAGLAALQEVDRRDKGVIHLDPSHAEYLTALYLSGDPGARTVKTALERPRSAAECLRLLQLEITFGQQPAPAPSVHVVRRWVREALPRIITDYARHGDKRALAWRGPYILRSRLSAQVNDLWYCDFRRSNVRAWIELNDHLYRIFCCAIMDVGSRDVKFAFDLYPSAQLYKSCLRRALLDWGVPREIWMDNGKEFTCQEILGGEYREQNHRFEIDDDARSIFAQLGAEPHYCLPKNPDGKAPLERFFQALDAAERSLPGWCGEEHKKRPERLAHEARVYCAASRGEAPDPVLWDVPRLADYETRLIDAAYRHRKHSGMLGKTPAMVQAAFTGVRRVPRPEELDLLLWHRKRLAARGDKVAFQYHGRTLYFRSEMLLGLPGDCEVEVHVDPLNADRAIAIDGHGKTIVLEPVNPEGRTTEDLKSEIHRQRSLEKNVRAAALLGSSLAPVRSPDGYLALYEAEAARKQELLEAERTDGREEFVMPKYAAAKQALAQAKRGAARRATSGELAREIFGEA